MKRTKRIVALVVVGIMLFSVMAFAMQEDEIESRSVGKPSMTTAGSTVYCAARVSFFGKSIDATMELYRGTTLVAWWTKSGTGIVSFDEPAPFISGMSYTLTVSGTVDGVAFTPQSTTQTLW